MEFSKIFVVLLCATTAALAADTDFTAEEVEALKTFRPMVSSLLNQPFMTSDIYLMRYLKAENLDVDRAKRRLEEVIQWRKTEKIDNILSENFSEVKKCTPSWWVGHDHDGRPAVFYPYGAWDFRRCLLGGQSEKMHRYMMAAMFEMGERLAFNSTGPGGNKVGNVHHVADLTGFNIRQGACLRCVAYMVNFVRTADKYYPGLIYKSVSVNAPVLFENFMTVIRPVLTVPIILEVYGYNKDKWGPVLARDMDIDQLPIALGGKRALHY